MAARPSATTLVFLHHFGGSGRTWDRVVEHLGNDFACVTPDLRGFGDARDAPGPYTVARYADDVLDMAADLDLRHYVIVGHSMGGKIALSACARRPAGLAGLVLLAPSPPSPEPMSEVDRAEMLAGHGDRAVALATIGKITARPLPATAAERLADDMVRSSPAAWAAWLEGGSRQDISADIDGLDVRTLVVVGVEDGAIEPAVQVAETLPRLRDARLVSMTGVGHLLPLEAAEAVADLIRTAARRSAARFAFT